MSLASPAEMLTFCGRDQTFEEKSQRLSISSHFVDSSIFDGRLCAGKKRRKQTPDGLCTISSPSETRSKREKRKIGGKRSKKEQKKGGKGAKERGKGSKKEDEERIKGRGIIRKERTGGIGTWNGRN